jgi:hypothetical protein
MPGKSLYGPFLGAGKPTKAAAPTGASGGAKHPAPSCFASGAGADRRRRVPAPPEVWGVLERRSKGAARAKKAGKKGGPHLS